MKLQTFIVNCRINIGIVKLMPNLQSLYIKENIDDLEKLNERYVPHIEQLELQLQSGVDVSAFVHFLHGHKQIKYLKLFITVSNYNDLIYSSIDENLTQLTKLDIYNFSSERKKSDATYRFKEMVTFSIRGKSEDISQYFESFEFDDLNDLTVGTLDLDGPNRTWTDIVLPNRKLEKFALSFATDLIGNVQLLLSELPELEMITTYGTRDEHKILKESLGNRWTCLALENDFDGKKILPLIFQRIQNYCKK